MCFKFFTGTSKREASLHPLQEALYVENGRSRLSSSFQHPPSSEQPIKNSSQSEAKRWQHCWERQVILVILPDDHWPN